jgi:hypothetical protein
MQNTITKNNKETRRLFIKTTTSVVVPVHFAMATVEFVGFVELEMISRAAVVNVAASIRFRLLAVELQVPPRASARPGGSAGGCSAEPMLPSFGGWQRKFATWD